MNQYLDRKNQKRLVLVNRDFQLRYAGAAVFVGVVSTLMTTGLILFPLYQFEILRIPRFLPPPVLALMGLAAVLNVALIGLMGVFITHRIAGPMYSLVRHFRSVEEGGAWASDMKLRDGDDLKYVVRNYNGMMSSIQSRTRNDLSALRTIKEKILISDSDTGRSNIESALEAINILEADIKSRLEDSEPNPIAS